MVMVTNKQFYMDGYLSNNLGELKKIVKKDWDVVILIDGGEGAGKSVLAQQVAYFFDETFTDDRMTIGLEDFEKAIMNAKPSQAIVGDEMMRLLNSKSAMTHINKRIVELLAEVRQKNLFIVLVMPSFFDMDKYAALWRSTALIHCYTGDGRERGFFGFYTEQKKKMLYLTGKKLYDYYKVKPNFVGRFTNTYLIDEEVYRNKKLVKLSDRPQKKLSDGHWRKKYETAEERLIKLSKYISENKYFSYAKQSEVLGLSKHGLFHIINKEKPAIEGFSLGNKPANRAVYTQTLEKGEFLPKKAIKDEFDNNKAIKEEFTDKLSNVLVND